MPTPRYQVKEGKLSHMKVYWGEPKLWDSLFVGGS